MNSQTEIVVKCLLSLLAVGVLVWSHRRSREYRRDRPGRALVLMAVVAVVAYFNFGQFHGTSAVHHWEQFHYFLGSKYFPELGYDGLYVASLGAERLSNPSHRLQVTTRDLRTNEVRPTRDLETHAQEVRDRFSSERWREFTADNNYFLASSHYSYIAAIRLDHGYNATPTWTFTARLFSRNLPASDNTLRLLAGIDVALLAVMFCFVFAAFGARAGCMCLIVFGLSYPSRYFWTGGAFLRQDWITAVGIGICLLKRRRFVWAGMLLAYAIALRVFPAAFLFGPAVVGIRALWQRTHHHWFARFGTGLAIGAVLFTLTGAATGAGLKVWPRYFSNLKLHYNTFLTNNVGVKNVLLYDTDILQRKDVDFALPEPWIHVQDKLTRLSTQRRATTIMASMLMLMFAAFIAWRQEVDQAALLGIVVIFATTLLTSYYWIMLLLVPLYGNRWAPVVVWLTINAGLYALHLTTESYEMIYGFMSYALTVFFMWWLWSTRSNAGRSKPAE